MAEWAVELLYFQNPPRQLVVPFHLLETMRAAIVTIATAASCRSQTTMLKFIQASSRVLPMLVGVFVLPANSFDQKEEPRT
jgi:hypothetical protein